MNPYTFGTCMALLRYIFGWLVLVGTLSCTDINIKVGKKEKTHDFDFQPQSQDAEQVTIRDVEFYLENLDLIP